MVDNKMKTFNDYLEAAYDGKGIPAGIDELIEKELSNLNRDELLDMVDMYVSNLDDEEYEYIGDADEAEIIDLILDSLSPKQKEKLRKDLYNKSFK